MELELFVRPGGRVACVHSDEAAAFLRRLGQGPPATRRASHVEPNDDGTWRADLAPSGGPVLSPYETRAEAVAAELSWIRENVLGRGDAPREGSPP